MNDADPETTPAEPETVGGWLPPGTCAAESVFAVGGQPIGVLSCTGKAGHDEAHWEDKDGNILESLIGAIPPFTHVTGTLHTATLAWGNIEALPACPECQVGKHGNCNGSTFDNLADRPAPCPCQAANPGLHPGAA